MSDLYPKVAQFKSVAAFRDRLSELSLSLPVDDAVLTAADDSPMARRLNIGGVEVGNRWCIHPMEGWDANRDGSPSELTLRRWRNFGLSGAKLIWGGEAAAVVPEGRANPNQTLATPGNRDGLKALLDELTIAHAERFGSTDDLLVGLQLTHSGRFCRPNSKQLEPRIAYHHPLLDEKFGIDPEDQATVLTDAELYNLIDAYVVGAQTAQEAGFRFVDIKSCHGYLMHEFLSARPRAGEFGGDFEARTRLLTTIITRVRDACPDLMICVRLSVFDSLPYKTSRGIGEPMDASGLLPYQLGFGTREDDPLEYDLTEPFELIARLQHLGVAALNVSCGSPYYNPHIQRPAIFPPSDGYQPPEDPLVGVVRQLDAARKCKDAFPEMPMVGSGYSYLQDFLPHVAQAVVREGWIDSVGLGRMVLSYPELPADTLGEGTMARRKVCRTFSDCTTAPRNGIVSGCFPLDPFYKEMDEAATLREWKQSLKEY
ncbi:MAG: NADH:flavin oxidoreductase [Planctomycetota bacterium]|nr:NADH:flavin oxidoreductase [Planctomycetota bacterium]MDA1252589.1 NADH:flavin oxidoreductase [Planctomycetota bacterium]